MEIGHQVHINKKCRLWKSFISRVYPNKSNDAFMIISWRYHEETTLNKSTCNLQLKEIWRQTFPKVNNHMCPLFFGLQPYKTRPFPMNIRVTCVPGTYMTYISIIALYFFNGRPLSSHQVREFKLPISVIWTAFWSQPKPGEMAPPSWAVVCYCGVCYPIGSMVPFLKLT